MRFDIWKKPVGDGAPCFVIAEIGSNHNGELKLAREMVEIAARAGADAVKFQTFRADRLYPKSAGRSDYLGVDTSIYDIIQAMEMPDEWLGELVALAHSLGLAFLSSPFHEEAVGVLEPHVDAFKIASYEVDHEPLLRAVVATGKPVIISTGASTFDEVERSVQPLAESGCRDLVVLQCTAAYPAPPESLEVGALVELRSRLGVLTGLSDHSLDPVDGPFAAAVLGAAVIEKHFTFSKTAPGPDHAFAVEPDGLKALVAAVRRAETVRGKARKRIHPVEEELRSFARRSIFTTRPIEIHERFTRENVDVLRQGKLGAGLPPSRLDDVLKGVAATNLKAEQPLSPSSVLVNGTALAENAARGQAAQEARTPDVRLRSATVHDAGLVWCWANDPHTRRVSLSSGRIPYRSHIEWFADALASDSRTLLIATRDADPVAMVRVDCPAAEDGDPVGLPEVSLNVAPDQRGRGVGRGALEALVRWSRDQGIAKLGAAILAGNDASRTCFENVGFRFNAKRVVRGAPVDWYVLDVPSATP